MAKGKQAAPTPVLSFDVTLMPYGLAALAALGKQKLSYTANDAQPEPRLEACGEQGAAAGDVAQPAVGYEAIVRRLLPGLESEAVRAIVDQVVPLLYGKAEADPASLEAAAELVQKLGLIPQVAPEADSPLGSVAASYMILGSPALDSVAPESLPGPLKELFEAYSQDKLLKSSKGQMQVALKKYEREHLPQGGPTLEGAVFGKVCTRFPPEPSGYLHIGHAKAAILNHYFARAYKGRLIFRLDDTNPSKENSDFVENIKRDLATLGVDWDHFSYSSDHFPKEIEFAERLIKEGKAYCDKTPSEQMQKERFDGVESAYRNASVEENWRLWCEMKAGSEEGQQTCLRAKISMENPNKCMRDPVIFRVNVKDVHHRTGTTYKVYPTYDFSCPIVDALEGVTHALRTTEFLDRNEQYYFFCDLLGLPKPKIQDFSRLRLQYSIMSKRQLQWFVDQKVVDNWYDPRFPTVQGLMRRGLRVDAIHKFILEQGASRKVNYQEWSKIWSTNKDFIEPGARRFHAIHVPVSDALRAAAEEAKKSAVQSQSTAEEQAPVIVSLLDSEGKPMSFSGKPEEVRKVPYHKKNAALGDRDCLFASRVFLDRADFEEMKAKAFTPGTKVTLMNWGNFAVAEVDFASGKLSLKELPGDTDYAGTLKLTWLGIPAKYAECDSYEAVLAKNFAEGSPDFRRVTVKYFGHLVSKAILGPDDDFRDHVNPHSLHIAQGLVPAAFCEAVKKGDTLQFERWGFYYVDSADGEEFVLHYIPEGKKSGQAGAFEFDN